MTGTHDNHLPERAKPREGDSLTVADRVALGDLVCWDRAPSGQLLLRRLDRSVADSYAGEIFQVAYATGENGVCLKLFRGAKP